MTENILKLPHKLSKAFVSHVATGAMLSGPTGDGLFHFVFYRDCCMDRVRKWKTKPENENIYETYIDRSDIMIPRRSSSDLDVRTSS